MLNLRGLGQISYSVSDVARTTAFFRDVLGVPFLFSPGPDMAFFDLWGTRLFVESGGSEPGTNSVLYFRVGSIEACYTALEGKVDFFDAPHLIATLPDHELWMFFIRDPDGQLIGFMEERPLPA
jgi:catechol 2,3-dioxygenase-like lactoylglutathione lyase family enzyme